MEKTLKEKEQDVIDVLKDLVRTLASEEAERLIERDPEKYYQGKASFGSYHNGVGWASYGCEDRYDEDLAYEDAIEAIAIDVANGGEEYHLLEDNKLTSAIANLIRSL